MAIACSGHFAKAFNALPLSQIPLSELKPKSDSTVVIEGGRFEVYRDILAWILRCGEAGKTVTFRWLSSPCFFDYGLVLLACEKLQVNVLQAQVLIRMQDIAALQVHSVDVERVFSAIPGPHNFRDMICQSIGQAMWEGRLQAMAAYKRLFGIKEYAEFKDGTDAVYEKLEKQWHKTLEGKIAKKEKEEKDQKAEEKREAAEQRREQTFKRAAAKRHNVEPSQITRIGKKEYTVSTAGRQVRKGQGGRPGFVQLDLDTLGVTRREFRPAESPTLPRKQNKATHNVKPARNSATSELVEDVKDDLKAGDVRSKGRATTKSVVGLGKSMEDMSIGKK